MRSVAFWVCAVLSLSMAAAPAPGQDKGKGKKDDDKKKPPVILEIGGRTFEQWLADISSKDRSKSAAAISTVPAFAPEQSIKALPVIIAELKKHRPPSAILDLSVRMNAPAAIVQILNAQKKPDQKMLQDAVDVLVPMLKDSQIIIRYRAMQALVPFGPNASKAIPDLVTLVKDFPTWETRKAAVVALGSVAAVEKGPEQRVVNALFSALKDTSSQVRLAAIHALEALNVPEIASYKDEMERDLEPLAGKDPEAMVRVFAHLSLYDLNKKKNSGRRAAIARLLVESPEPQVRIAAAEALGRIGEDSVDQIPALLSGLADKDPNVIGNCVMALREIGTAASQSLPQLRKIMKDETYSEVLRKTAEDAIDYISGKKKKEPPKGEKK